MPIRATFAWLTLLQGPDRETGGVPLGWITAAVLKKRRTDMAMTPATTQNGTFLQGAFAELAARFDRRNGRLIAVLVCASALPLAVTLFWAMLGHEGAAFDPTPYAICVGLVGLTWLICANQTADERVANARLQAALSAAETRLIDLALQRDELERQLNLDPLTGVNNRRGVEPAFIAHGAGTVMALLDIDHFKKINDTYGHAVGDRVLKDFTRLLRTRLADALPIYRVGGEEFVVLFPDAAIGDVAAKLDKFRTDLAVDSFARTSDRVPVSFSAGLAVRETEGHGFSEMFKLADDRLYAAKMAGRARTVYADQDGQGALAIAG